MGVKFSSSSKEKSRIPLSLPSYNKTPKNKRKTKKNNNNSSINESSPTFTNNVGCELPATLICIGGISLVTTRHISKDLVTYVSHFRDSPPMTASHVGGMNVDQKPSHRIFKPKFPCKLCNGDNLTHLFPWFSAVKGLWFESDGPSTPQSTMVSHQSNQPLVDEVVEQLQYLADSTPLCWKILRGGGWMNIS